MGVVVNEVVPDPVKGEDWVEFFNAGNVEVDLEGWTFTDDDPTHVFTFGKGVTLEAGAYLTLERNAPNSFTFGLGTGGDAINLFNENNEPVDATTWTDGDANAPTSWGRFPNATGDFGTRLVVTKGTINL